jgi:sigma-B regulation protein RsbU (phosphoserine phosphatase)
VEPAKIHRYRAEENDRHLKRLKTIREVGEVFSTEATTDRILSLLLELALAISEAEVGAISLVDGDESRHESGITWGLEETVTAQLLVCEDRTLAQQALFSERPVAFPRLQGSEFPKLSGTGVVLKSVAAFPLIFKGQKIGVLQVANAPTERLTDEGDLTAIGIVASLTAAAIFNARLHQESLAKERLEHELNLARRIQRALLPQSMPKIPGAEAAGFSVPARVVGGDYFDILRVNQRVWGFFIADVAGKGVPAAMLSMIVRSYLRACYKDRTDPAAVLEHLNRLLVQDITEGRFVTAMYTLWDSERSELSVAGAGHLPGFLRRRGARRIDRLGGPGLPLGIFPETRYTAKQAGLKPGDLFCTCTDGVLDPSDPFGRGGGFQRLEKLLIDCTSNSAQALSAAIRRAFAPPSKQAAPYDDLTLMILQATGK